MFNWFFKLYRIKNGINGNENLRVFLIIGFENLILKSNLLLKKIIKNMNILV